MLRLALGGAGLALGVPWLGARPGGAAERSAGRPSLNPPDANGVRLPPGFSSRIVARSGQPPVPGSSYLWPDSPDGGATFATTDGGWVYVSNSELPANLGGVGALRFDRQGTIAAAYSILRGTTLNCAGGATPWGTWLSCEEYPRGRVWECDPLGVQPAVVRPALGTFQHEAIAVDAHERRLYLTEDTPAGRFYRFTPARRLDGGRYDLSAGLLEACEVRADGSVTWHAVPDPSAADISTAEQVPNATAFAGGEGITIRNGVVYFTTKLDDRVWAYEVGAQRLSVYYDDDRQADAILTGVDNITVSPAGELVVAEDGGDMQLVAFTARGEAYPLLQVVGHDDSEIAGPAFDPSGRRLYFSSQRGKEGHPNAGITFEVSGPFESGLKATPALG